MDALTLKLQVIVGRTTRTIPTVEEAWSISAGSLTGLTVLGVVLTMLLARLRENRIDPSICSPDSSDGEAR